MSPDDPVQLQISVPKWLDTVNTLGMNTARMMSMPREQANNAYATTTKADLIKYLHQAAFSPVKKTWMKAIENGQFATWPGLTKEAVQKYLAESSPATDGGHMSRQRKNIRSTKKRRMEKGPQQSSIQRIQQRICTHVWSTTNLTTYFAKHLPLIQRMAQHIWTARASFQYDLWMAW